MKKYQIKTTRINYCIDEEDFVDIEESQIQQVMAEIYDKLPQVMELNIVCEEEDLEELITDEITEKTGWLLYGYDYKIVKATEM